ncbi:MAG: DUF1015 domain-containing protein [Zavarzinella sp.]
MADIRAFRGFRYDLGKAGTLSEVIAPPYDVIGPELQQQLYDQNPYNAIRLELNRDEPGDTPTNNKYSRAAQTLNGWLQDHVLQQDTLRNLYVLEQEYTVDGTSYRRRGFFARVRLEPFGTGKIFPHEETMSGPKEDRLKLYRATGFNISPIFGLYPDDQNSVFQYLEPLLHRQLPLAAHDHLGVQSKLWMITDEAIINAVVAAMQAKPVFIADGHHRYETGLKYLEEVASTLPNNESPAHFTLMMLVSMSDPGLSILPTHRLVRGLPGLTSAQLREALEPHFAFEPVADATSAWEAIEMDGGQALLAFHTQADKIWQLARFQAPKLMASLVPDRSDEWRGLGVSILHIAAINHLLKGFAQPAATCQYVHLTSEVDDAIKAGTCDVAALVAPASMLHVEEIAGNLEKMPPKSTYFYPKLPTGLVFNSLKSH